MWLYHVTRASRPLFSLVWKMRLTGAVDAIPRTGPAIVVANHSSFVDPWFLGPFLFPRPVHFLITRQWYDKSAVSRFVFRSYGTIPMESEPAKTLDAAVAALDTGRVVGIFPEGRISHDGNIQRFRTGVCYLAARSGVAVIPVGLRGAFESLPRDRRLPRRGRITLTLGEPMTFPGSPVQAVPPRNEVREFRDRLSTEVHRLAGQGEKVSGTFSVPETLMKRAD
jgi:1-acyl-sn-glycerol-3-phosphate acyltransferase